MLKTYKYRLYPNKEQRILLSKHFGACRWIYNYALAKIDKIWTEEKKYTSAQFGVGNELPGLKKQDETKWLKEVNSQVLQQSLQHLDTAYSKFFKKTAKHPKFKSRKNNRQSFSIPQHIYVDWEKNRLDIPKFSMIKMKVDRKFEGLIKTTTIVKVPSNKYFACILVEDAKELPKSLPIEEGKTVGIDLGLRHFATLSDGRVIENQRFLKKTAKILKRRQQVLSRKVKGSSNRRKQRLVVARTHEKLANQRNDFLHKLTCQLTHENQVNAFVMEDLAVAGMLKNHCLAKGISDVAWSTFRAQLEYKCSWYGRNLLTIGRFEPSSRLCSSCGDYNHDLKLGHQNFICKGCGNVIDRDLNAAINIKYMGLHPKIRSGRPEFTLVESGVSHSLKQEISVSKFSDLEPN